MSPILVVLVGVCLACAAFYYNYQRDAKRRAALVAFAASEGWTYSARDDSWAARFTGSPFGEGDHREARNVMCGTVDGRPMAAFDFSYQTHNSDGRGGSDTTTHRFAVCALALPAILPRLELSPESVLSRIGSTLGMQDIELESEDFNRRYRVQATDPKFAYDVLNPRTMQVLISRPALHLRLAGSDALCWEAGITDAVTLLSRLSVLKTLLAGIPSYVWSDHSSGGTSV